MKREDIEMILDQAIDRLIANDAALLDLGVTERAMSHQLARYLSDYFGPPLSVDCEYNRHFGDPKRLMLPRRDALDRETRATTVFPDIIVHERNSDEHNLVVLELKKPGESTDYDERKLRAFRAELGYRYTAHIILGLDEGRNLTRKIIWVEC